MAYQPNSDLTLTITPPTTGNNFGGFVTIDGIVTNSVLFGSSKSTASVSVCSFNSTVADTYPFSLALSGTNVANYSLTNPTLNVSVREMIVLTFPDKINVPKSGCSSQQQLTNPNNTALPGILYIRIGSDSAAMYFGNTSANTLTIDNSTTYPVFFTICSDETVVVGTNYNPKIIFSGASSPVVQGNVNSINATISAVPPPSFFVDDPTTDFRSG